MTVVDASVAVKWLTAEERRDAANRILEGADKLIGPALLRVETAAAITRKALLSEVTVQEAHEALEVWAAIIRGTLDLMPEDEDLPGALKLALELKHENTTVSSPVAGSTWRCKHCAQISFIMHCIGELTLAMP